MAVVETIEVGLKGKGVQKLIEDLNKVADACKRVSQTSAQSANATQQANTKTSTSAKNAASATAKAATQTVNASKAVAKAYRGQAKDMMKNLKPLDLLKMKYEGSVEKLAEMLATGKTNANTLATQTEKCQKLGIALSNMKKAVAKTPQSLRSEASQLIKTSQQMDLLKMSYKGATAKLVEMIKYGKATPEQLSNQISKCQKLSQAMAKLEEQQKAATEAAKKTPEQYKAEAAQMVETSKKIDLLKAKYEGATEKLADMIKEGKSSPAELARQTEKCQELAASIQKEEAAQNKANKTAEQAAAQTSKVSDASAKQAQQIIETTSHLDVLRAKYNGAVTTLGEMISSGTATEEELTSQAEKCQKLAKEIDEYSKSAKKASKASSTFKGSLSKISDSIKGLARSLGRIAFYRAVRSMVKSITDAFSTGLENVYRFSQIMGTTFANTMDNMATKSYTMKNQLGAAFAGLLSAIMPILLKIISLVTAAANAITMLFSAFSGGTYLKAKDTFQSWKDTAEGGAAAAAEWKNQLMGFDEINRLEDQSSSGGGGSSTPDYSSMFEEVEIPEKLKSIVEWIKEHLEDIKKLAIAIGIAFLAWELIKFVAQLGNVSILLTTVLSKLGSILAPLLTIAGIALTIYGIWDMWENGIDWDNLSITIGGIELAVLGLYLAFGQTAAAIALLVGGIALLAVGIKEWITTGEASTETLTAITVGLVAVGAAIALLTGSWIPLVIAAIGAAAVWIVGKWDEIAEWGRGVINKVKTAFGTLGQYIVDKFGGAWDILTGIIKGDVDKVQEGTARLEKSWGDTWDEVSEKVYSSSNSATKSANTITNNTSKSFSNMSNNVKGSLNNMNSNANSSLSTLSSTFSGKFSNISSAISGSMNSATNSVYSSVNSMQSAINSLNYSNLLSGTNTYSTKKTNTYSTKKYASGGTPATGSLFIAGERGAELVSSAGGSTSVSNGDQIANSVSVGNEGVISAVYAMANAIVKSIDSKDTDIKLDGMSLARNMYKYNNRASNEHGKSLVNFG